MFFNRIAAVDYVPTNDDILKARIRTSGITEEQYDVDGVKCKTN
jgi:hypothetical protein